MNLFKKTTATIALVALVSGIFSAGVSAASSTEIEAANALAAKGFINDHSDDTAAYNLNQNVLRQEIAAVARGISGEAKKTTCDNTFTDVSATTPNTWACYSIEALSDADLIAKNAKFNPENEISKAEAVGMMVKAAFGSEYSYDSNSPASWQKQVVEFAVSKGVVANFTNYDTAATRGFVFEAGSNAVSASEVVASECDEVSQLLGLCDGGTTETTTTTEETTTTTEETTTTTEETTTTTEETTTTETVVTADNVLVATLSDNTAAGSDLPRGATGIEVLSFDVTAGSEDVSITSIELGRTGFGVGAAAKVAIYSEEGRASKARSFSNEDLADLNFNPAIVVKAGETRTLTAKVSTDAINFGQFAVSVENITASSTVDAATIVSNYFDVKNTKAVQLTILNQDISSNLVAGEEQADLAEFKLTNESLTSTTVDITVSSITLKEIGTIDQEVDLENLTLSFNGEVISTVASMNGKYVTFDFDPIVIEDSKNEIFTVKGDTLGGAGKTIIFELNSPLDITTTASKYNAAEIAGTFTSTSIKVSAGDLVVTAIDAETTDIREDMKNVVLGQVKIVNVAGKNLELGNINVNLVSTGSGVTELVNNVEFEFNGTSYALDTTTADNNITKTPAKFKSDTDLGLALPQGTTILTVRADTKLGIPAGDTLTLSLDTAIPATPSDADLYVIESDNSVQVEDISSPGTFKKVTLVEASATLSNINLVDEEVVKGSTGNSIFQFDIEAGKASYITARKFKVTLTASGAPATKNEIAEVALYKTSVSDANLLDRVSGSKLSSGLTPGVATFNGFDVEIPANDTETFIVTVSTAVTTNVNNKVIEAKLVSNTNDLTIEDDNRKAVTINGSLSTPLKQLTVRDSGKLTLTANANLDANLNIKTVLAGTEEVVFSSNVKADNEDVNVERVVFTVDKDLTGVAESVKLYLDGSVVATANNTKVTSTTITFDNIIGFDIGTTEAELKLGLVTYGIGKEFLGNTVSTVLVTKVDVQLATGVDSGKDVTVTALTATSAKAFNVVPAVVTASASNVFGNGTDNNAGLTFAVNVGSNTDNVGSALDATLSGITLDVTSNTTLSTATGTLTLLNSNGDTVAVTDVNSTSTGVVLLAGLNNGVAIAGYATEIIANGEVYTIEATSNTLATFKLTKTGVKYIVDGTTYDMNSNSTENLGTNNNN